MSNQNAMHSNVVILQHLRINMKNYHFLFCFQRNEMLHSYLKRETITESFIGKCERMRANAHRLFTILHFNIANFNCYESCAQRVKQRTEWLGQALTRFGPSNWNSFFFLLYFSIRQALIRFVFTFDSYFSLSLNRFCLHFGLFAPHHHRHRLRVLFWNRMKLLDQHVVGMCTGTRARTLQIALMYEKWRRSNN